MVYSTRFFGEFTHLKQHESWVSRYDSHQGTRVNSRELRGRLRGVWAVSISLRLSCRLRDRRIHEGTGLHKGGLKRATQESSANRGAEAAREALRREGAILRDSGRIGQNRRIGTPKPRRFRNPLRRPNRHQSERESSTLNAPSR